MSCRHVRDWLHRDTAELDEAQRLVLDDHLAGCEPCQGDRARLRQVRTIGTQLQPGLEPRDYNRAIARALMEGAPRREAAPARRPWIYALAGLALAGAASAAIALRMHGSTTSDEVATPQPAPRAPAPRPEAPPPEPPRAAPDDVVETGSLHAGDQVIATGSAVPAGTVLSGDGAAIRLRDVRVVLAASAQIVWLPAERAVLLEAGRVEVALDGDRELVVRTGDVVVAIASGAATVSRGHVEVQRGAARIVGRDGRAIASLAAGQTWTAPVAALDKPRTNPPPQKGPTLAELLRLAETAQAQGQLELAIERYTAIASAFRTAPEAESALYAAARLELRLGRSARAKALLDDYLSRYPRGRYVDDVRRELTVIR